MHGEVKGNRRSTALRRRRADRRNTGSDYLPPPSKQESLFNGIRAPLRTVLDRLEKDRSRIERSWRGLLARLDSSRDDYDLLAGLDLVSCYRHLSLSGRGGASSSGDEAYRLAIERGARSLMRSSVPEDHAVAAVAFHLEACLSSLKTPAETKALVRLSSMTQRLVAAVYCEERVAGLRRLDDRERQKLSGDLHDEVGADLVVLKLYVEMIAMELAKGNTSRVGPKLQETLVLIAHAIESVRRLTLDLGPAFLDSLGFLPALRSVVRQFALRTRIKVELDEIHAGSLPASHETALYRVLLGALSNVAKHSKARNVKVSLRSAGSAFLMTIEDDGKGFDVRDRGTDRSFGITAMSERVRGLQGRLYLESQIAGRAGEKSGTRIEVRLPLRKRLAA